MGQIEILMGNDFFKLPYHLILYRWMIICTLINGCMWKNKKKNIYVIANALFPIVSYAHKKVNVFGQNKNFIA